MPKNCCQDLYRKLNTPPFIPGFCGAGTSNPSGAPQFTSCFCGVRVDQSLVFCEVFCRSLFVFCGVRVDQSLVFCEVFS